MELYIGGCAQGKLNYVLQQTKIAPDRVADGAKGRPEPGGGEVRIINHFHLLVRSMLKENQEPEAMMEELLSQYPRLIIISDEVGNGIVPMAKEDREYRERLGRILCQIASRAEKVERVICGIGQRIK